MSESDGGDICNEIVTCEVDDTTCSVCYAEFLDFEDLDLHLQQVHPTLPPGTLEKCQFCKKCFTDAETYVLHIRNDHILNFKSCSVCHRVFTNSRALRKHVANHPPSMGKGAFACSQCNQFFMYKSELIAHEVDTHYDSEGVFLNKYYALLSSVLNMKAETFIQSIGSDKIHDKTFTYTCSRCKYRNMDLESYVIHLKKSNCRSFVCDKCCKVYNKKAGLIYHVSRYSNCDTVKKKTRHENNVKTKQCSKCKEYFDSKSMKKHKCKPNMKCPHCEIVFDNLYELSEHQNTDHPMAVSLVMCKFCRKECIGPDALEKHIQRAHDHELHLFKYTCSYCDGITFKHPQRLFAHYLLKHKDIEPYLCKICDKKFRVRKGFTLHIKLQHKSEGYVEFDEKLHVFFSDKKSEKPFIPVSKYVQANSTEDHQNGSGDREEISGKSKELQLVNIDSDENPNDIEGNKTDDKETTGRKRKKDDINEVLALSDYDSDDEPLLIVKKKAKLKSRLRTKPLKYKKKKYKNPKKQFTCEVCKKYCYTFLNYQNHVNMHFRDESKKCVKCFLSFKTKADLERHMTDQHSSSELTKTLKTILERRKKGEQKQEPTVREKFLNTIKKVQIEKDYVTATLTPITKELSVQKFIENFTPEGGEAKNTNVLHSVSVTKTTNPVQKEPLIKMIKFRPAPQIDESRIKLAMPVKFKKSNEMCSISVRKVLTRAVPTKINVAYEYDDGNQSQDDDGNHFQDDDNDHNYNDNRYGNIPEVEQEVTLEGTEEVPKRNPVTHKIVIPKLPTELKSIRIAHLLPEAPYYKIVKMDDIMKSQDKAEVDKDGKGDAPEEVRLPDGTKLVHVNPLAHLLGDTPVEKIMNTNKYYKPRKIKNFEEVLTNALRKLDNPGRPVKKKKEQKKNKEESTVPDVAVSEIVTESNNTDDINTNDVVADDGKEVTENSSQEEVIPSDLIVT